QRSARVLPAGCWCIRPHVWVDVTDRRSGRRDMRVEMRTATNGGVVESSELDVFISYTRVDVDWAQWIATQLEQAGYRTFVQVLDIHPGQDFMHELQKAETQAQRPNPVL